MEFPLLDESFPIAYIPNRDRIRGYARSILEWDAARIAMLLGPLATLGHALQARLP
jgi:hypothetical protein